MTAQQIRIRRAADLDRLCNRLFELCDQATGPRAERLLKMSYRAFRLQRALIRRLAQ
jgi:hypothetical protein